LPGRIDGNHIKEPPTVFHLLSSKLFKAEASDVDRERDAPELLEMSVFTESSQSFLVLCHVRNLLKCILLL